MQLKSGCIFWPQLDSGPLISGRSLTQPVSTEVAIIGSGITGALCAYYFSREKIPTVLVDRRGLAQGSTLASTGLLQYELDVRLMDLAQKIGPEKANRAYRASLEALLAFPLLVKELEDDCGLTPRESLYLAIEDAEVEVFRAEQKAREVIGIEVDFLSRADLHRRFSISRPAALLSHHAFEVDPYRLTLRLLQRSMENGLLAFSQTEVGRYEPHGQGVILHTSAGHPIHSRKVIFATGYETPVFLPEDICRLRTTFALVSEPLANFDGWPGRPLVWESGQPYFYLRSTVDGRAMLGGEDEDSIDPAFTAGLIPDKSAILCAKFKSVFPGISIQPACAWAGIFAETEDGLPCIGSVPEFPHGHFALGYGGNGITFSLLAARQILDHYLGRPTPDADLFRFPR